MKECVFCSVAMKNDPPHQILWSDENHVAFLDAHPVREGHTLVVPKKHVGNILDMSDTEYSGFFLAGKRVSEKLRKFFSVERIGFMVEGLAVDHVHLHLIPIHSGVDIPTFSRLSVPPVELSVLGEKLRTVFK